MIDVHHHWLPRALVDNLESYLPEGYSVRRDPQTKRFFGGPAREGHGGYTLEQARRAMERMLFDTAPAGWYGPAEIQFAIDALGVDRVAFGSDYPHGQLAEAANHIHALRISEPDKLQVADGNVKRLYAL